MSYYDLIKEKIQLRKIKVGVVGLGYVGLPLAVEKARAGFDTTGFDIQPKKVDMVNHGYNYIGDVIDDDLWVGQEGKMRATSDFSFVKDMNLSRFVCQHHWICINNQILVMSNRLRSQLRSI